MIKFNTGDISPASASSSDEEEDEGKAAAAANGETSHGWLPEDGRQWMEESWKSDSGFNSDNAAVVAAGSEAQRDDACRPSTLPISRLSLQDNLPDGSDNKSGHDSEGRTKTNGVSNDDITANGKLISEAGGRDESNKTMLKSDRFNPFNKVPFIEEEHFESPTISNTPRYNFHEATTSSKKLEPGKSSYCMSFSLLVVPLCISLTLWSFL